jgi:hypothetical protein
MSTNEHIRIHMHMSKYLCACACLFLLTCACHTCIGTISRTDGVERLKHHPHCTYYNSQTGKFMYLPSIYSPRFPVFNSLSICNSQLIHRKISEHGWEKEQMNPFHCYSEKKKNASGGHSSKSTSKRKKKQHLR